MDFHFDPKRFEQCHILVIGDVMLDRYFWGDVKRISPEAPVPVFHIKKQSELCGGAGNVVSNLVGLGCFVNVIGVSGTDEAGKRLNKLLNNDRVHNLLLKNPERSTITKTRIVSNGQQLIRLDDEEVLPVSSDIQNNILKLVEDSIEDCDAIILSDYGKGVLQTPGLAQSIIGLAYHRDIPIMVDPKGKDWGRYKNATCVTPNVKEIESVYGDVLENNENLIEAMHSILMEYGLSWLLVTKGPRGMCLLNNNETPIFIPALAREVYDVSGAGDTVIATLTLGIASGLTFPEAASLANIAAGIVVGKVGTQPINLLELEASIARNGERLFGSFINKVTSLKAAEVQVQAWKANGDTIVFTNGCFDLLHPGHIHLLNQSKNLGARLIVGLNSDASVKRLKGSNRPILNEHDRASLLGSLNCVDLVVIFDEDTPKQLIKALSPDILAKGTDYRLEEVVGRELIESYGGQVQLIELLDGHSTTGITKRILQSHDLHQAGE